MDLAEGQEPQDSLRYTPLFNDELPRQFAVAFDLKVPLQPQAQLVVNMLAIFDTVEDLTPEVKASHFTRVNAPAVAYPYLRALVSQFAALGGFEPCILPVKNFMAGKIISPPASTQTASETCKDGEVDSSH